MESFTISAPLWRWQSSASAGGWFFLTIEGDVAEQIRIAAIVAQWQDGRRGFGSARVRAVIGDTEWSTSVFPDKQSGGWLLPVKAAVRKAEGLGENDRVTAVVSL